MNAHQAALAQSFWERPVAGSVVTGLVAALTALIVAVFTYRGGQRSLRQQLDASRDSWLRDHLLKEVSEYLAAARGVADQAFLVGATQVHILANAGRPREATAVDAGDMAKYEAALDGDAGLQRERDELRKRQHEFSGLVHGVRLLLAPDFEVAEELRANTDRFFGYVTHIRPDISDEKVHDSSENCRDLREKLEKQVAGLLGRSDLFAARATQSTGTK